MRRRVLFLLMFILVVPFVSGGIFDWGKMAWSFGIGNWNPSIMGVISIVVFLVMVIFFIRHRAGSYARGYGRERSRIRSELRARKRARKDEKLEANQLRIDRRIDDNITRLRKIEVELNREEINLNKQLYELEEYEKRLMYWEKKIGRYLLKLEGEIDGIVRFIQKGKLKNPVAARQNLEKLYWQFVTVAQKHYSLLERFRVITQKEERLVDVKADEERKEEAIIEGEKIEDRKEFEDIKDELGEALDERRRLEEAGAPRKEIKQQQKKIKDIILRRKTVKKEYKGEKKEEYTARKEERLLKVITERLNRKEQAIDKIERIEATLAHKNVNDNPSLIKINKNKLKDQLQILKVNSVKAMKYIEELRSMDRKNILLEKREEGLQKRRQKWSDKEGRIMAKAA